MARKKSNLPEVQTSFNFAVAATSAEIADGQECDCVCRNELSLSDSVSTRVVRIEDHRRSRYLELVRKLLAETGVFHVR